MPLGARTAERLGAYLEGGRPHLAPVQGAPWILLSQTGRQPSREAISRHRPALRPRGGDHQADHPALLPGDLATSMLRNGAHRPYVQEMLGHRSAATLDPYLRLTVTELREVHARCHPRERPETRDPGRTATPTQPCGIMPIVAYSGVADPAVKHLFRVGSRLDDLRDFPGPVRQHMGYALYLAQTGGKHDSVKPLKGFGGAGTLEIVAAHEGNAYLGICTVRFEDAVYVLHTFQKKSRKGIATSKSDIDLVRRRLRDAREQHREWLETRQEK